MLQQSCNTLTLAGKMIIFTSILMLILNYNIYIRAFIDYCVSISFKRLHFQSMFLSKLIHELFSTSAYLLYLNLTLATVQSMSVLLMNLHF